MFPPLPRRAVCTQSNWKLGGLREISLSVRMSVPPGMKVRQPPERSRRKERDMRDWGAALGTQGWLMAETLGLAMARRAADILERHRDALTLAAADPDLDPGEFAADDAVFTAVLDAANECLGQFDSRPPGERWCDTLLQVLRLAEMDAPGV